MSCSAFYCELNPQKRLRRLPLLCGALALLLGAALIVRMPLPLLVQIPAVAGWLVFACNELYRFSQASAEVRRLRLGADGAVVARMADGRWRRVTLLQGSLVLRRLAWLRLQLPDGRRYGELLIAAACAESQWHRLQLVWRQNRDAFGAVT